MGEQYNHDRGLAGCLNFFQGKLNVDARKNDF